MQVRKIVNPNTLTLAENLANFKNITEDDLHRVFWMIQKYHDKELHLMYSHKRKNRIYTIFKGSIDNITFEIKFDKKGDAYRWLMSTYGSDHPVHALPPV